MQPESSHSSEPSIETLPDASMLLNSPDFSSSMLTGGNHSSRVAAAMAENASRKRDLKELNFSHPRSKVPKGSLPHSKNVPDTSGGMLVPPQLRGRLVLTRDICIPYPYISVWYFFLCTLTSHFDKYFHPHPFCVPAEYTLVHLHEI